MLRHFVRPLYHLIARFGGFGLLALSVIDSSPLFLPFGNDLMLIAMTARKHNLMFYYAFMSSIGSTLGCLVDDLLVRKEGEKGLERTLSPQSLQYVKKRIKKGEAWAVIVACLMPPPFPFTPIIAGAAALQYPRKKLLSAVAITRFLRFIIEGLLAILFGRRILRLAQSRVLEYVVVLLGIISVVGSVIAVVRLIKQSRAAGSGGNKGIPGNGEPAAAHGE